MAMIDFGVGIISTGHYLPKRILSNKELVELIDDTSEDWIIEKTGIKRRHYVAEDENASDMAYKVCRDILEKTSISINEIGLIIIASFSQDYMFPPMSAKVHNRLGAGRDCQIFDINTNCTGLVTAMSLGVERMKSDQNIKYTLVVGVELLSRFTDLKDRDTSIFFSDGASAVLLGRVKSSFGLIGSKFATDSSTYESVRLVRGGSSRLSFQNLERNRHIEQNGLATWKQAITNLPYVINSLMKTHKLENSDLDFVIFHQANKMLIDYLIKKLKIDGSKTFINVEEVGNTGSASIGIALSEAFEKDMISSNSLLMIAGVGAGFNFGASLWRMH